MRMRWGMLLVALAAVGLAPACSSSGGSSDGGGGSGGGGTGAAVAREADGRAIPGGRAPGDRPAQAWTADAACTDYGCSAFADDDGVFVRAGGFDVTAVTAFEPATGKQQWRRTFANRTTVDLVGHHLMAISEQRGRVEVLDRATGKARWTKAVRRPVPTGFELDDLVFVGSRDRPTSVVALDADDGHVRWRAQGFVGAICDGTAYLVRSDALVAVDARTGDRRWTVPRRGKEQLRGSVCAEDGGADVVVQRTTPGAKGQVPTLQRLQASSGKVRWTLRLPGDGELGPDRSGDTVVVAGLDKIRGLIAGSGEVLWTHPIDHDRGGAPLVHPRGGSLLVQQSRLGTAVVDAETGKTTSRLTANDRDAVLPWSDAVLVVGGSKVAAYDGRDLHHRWTITAPGATSAAPGGGRIYVLSPRGLTAYA